MRLLVACPQCHRQYDASRRRIGSQFRCHCGNVVAVHQPQGHEAQVVRCSACGGTPPDGATRCPYCQSEFTLLDRDLGTVCPNCLALVSDQARYCHHCGTGLVPELDAGTDTKLLCPACQDGHCLVSRQLGAARITILECGRCAGFWLGHEAFRQLVERAQQEALPAGTVPETPQHLAARFGLPTAAVAPEPHGHVMYYRPCPVCSEQMNRLNYGRDSGVIIDICREHGIWFDAEELARILAWLRAGGGRKTSDETPPPEQPPARWPTYDRIAEEHPQGLLGYLLGWLVGLSD